MQAGLAKNKLSFLQVFTFFFEIIWIAQFERKPKSGLDLLSITCVIHS
tara:strand:- start:228 stop:371 length:144 start_codon:yes stop_codon:yes gene_type:complete